MLIRKTYSSNDIIHHSRLDAYRYPQGAVLINSTVTLRLSLGNSLADAVCFVNTYVDGIETIFEMNAIRKNGSILMEAQIPMPESPGLLYYNFTINDKSQLLYYGAPHGGGKGAVYEQKPLSYQITVHKPYEVPDWFKNSIIYHIFVDRFNRVGKGGLSKAYVPLGKGRAIVCHDEWEEEPLYEALPGREFYDPCDFFGGDLQGIISKLDYIKSLGVGCIYLSPIFESPSNHKYNTSDYMNVDPMFGTNEDFVALCEKCAEMGIRVMLDGVFSHTGSDSIYFNRDGRYSSVGAYQSKDSDYYDWYTFKDFPNDYISWWGFKSLPEVNELCPSYIGYTLSDDDSVIKTWLKRGASGFRLDVADELPDEYIKILKKELKKQRPDAVLLGEVWEDASNKYSHNQQRQYVMGDELDSVMNYPFREAVLGFFLGRLDSDRARLRLEQLRENYPAEFFYSTMNLLSSHDVPRALSLLSGAPDKDAGLSRKQQAEFSLSKEQQYVGEERLAMAMLLQYTLPGIPSVYYADEAGATGLMDPFNRRTFPWGRERTYLLEFARLLGACREDSEALKAGRTVFISPHSDLFGAVRFILDGKDVFGKEAQNDVYIILVNRSKEVISTFVDFNSVYGPDAGKLRGYTGEYRNLITGESYFCEGMLYIKLEALGGVLLRRVWS